MMILALDRRLKDVPNLFAELGITWQRSRRLRPKGAGFESPGRGTDSMRIGRPGFLGPQFLEPQRGEIPASRNALMVIGISPPWGCRNESDNKCGIRFDDPNLAALP